MELLRAIADHAPSAILEIIRVISSSSAAHWDSNPALPTSRRNLDSSMRYWRRTAWHEVPVLIPGVRPDPERVHANRVCER